jgi:hypothetical protein
MTTAETIFVSMTAAFAVINFGLNSMQSVLIDRYKALLKDYYDKLDEVYTKDDEVLKYCLVQILKKAIEDEDYETAERCKSLLSNLTELKTAKK